jgi:predicted N-formylglutamate amidohydrolase
MGRSDWLLTVEHAGRAVPSALGDLGLPLGEIDRHIGWDPGALELAQCLADRLDATVIAQRYSRLVIDCNRPMEAPDLVPEISDKTPIPANKIGRDERRLRWDEIHVPFHSAVARALDNGAKRIIAVHSYDPQRDVDGSVRPWPIGLLARVSNPLFDALSSHLSRVQQVAPLGVNEPYEIEEESDYTIPFHAEARDLPHVLLEVRNDYLRDDLAVIAMADTIAEACKTLEPL